jgi:hypothetical protein
MIVSFVHYLVLRCLGAGFMALGAGVLYPRPDRKERKNQKTKERQRPVIEGEASALIRTTER